MDTSVPSKPRSEYWPWNKEYLLKIPQNFEQTVKSVKVKIQQTTVMRGLKSEIFLILHF